MKTDVLRKEKLTPFDIAEDTIKIVIPESEYNIKSQVRFDKIDPVLSITRNATQTFDIHGRPNDNDDDK
jgi:hypothetical protein